MPFKTAREINDQHGQDVNLRDRAAKLFAVRLLYKRSIRPQSFEPSQEFADAIAFTKQGEDLVATAVREFGCSPNSAAFCVFLVFFHHDLLIDIEKTKVAKLLECLSHDILAHSVSFPWLFDHILYDRAFQSLPQRPRELSIKQTQDVLAGSPDGVFQVGQFVVGPFGVMQSDEKRLLLPTLSLPLYHCEDRMCGDVHVAWLAQPDSKHFEIVEKLDKFLGNDAGPASEWFEWLMDQVSDHEWYDDLSLANLPWLLGNGFSQNELRDICEQIIFKGKKEVRSKIPPQFSDFFAASSTSIAQKLSKPQALQVTLLALDKSISAVIDSLIFEKRIRIPNTEKRSLVAASPVPSWTHAVPECSDLGLRVVGRGVAANPPARLKSLVLKTYCSEDSQTQLKWSLRHVAGSSVAEQLESLMWSEPPAKLLRNLIVNNIAMLKSALVQLKSEHLEFPDSDAEEALFVQRLLWKMGFEKTEYESSVAPFWERLRRFQSVVSSAKQEDESWISTVRSVGVNLFVRLEELLSNTLAFLCWVFLADPLADAHIYNARKSRLLIAKELNGLVETTNGPVVFDPDGKNTMLPLIIGFTAFARRVREVLGEREKYVKEKLLLAHYHGKNSVQIFPYKHTKYVCDASDVDAQSIVQICEETAAKLQQSKVFEIRNKLEHNNEEIPSAKEMAKAGELLSDVVAKLQDCGLVPVIFAFKKAESDVFSRAWIASQDASGREIRWQTSPVLMTIRSLPSVGAPQIIVAGFNVPETKEPLRFGVQEDSDYTKMWQDYPKHGRAQASEESSRQAVPSLNGEAGQIKGEPIPELSGSSTDELENTVEQVKPAILN